MASHYTLLIWREIQGSKIVVRTAKEEEVIRTLDGQDRTLDSEMLVICDENCPVAVAGVMGGENSEVTDDTRVLLLESANFKGSSVRITGKKMGLRSEAAIRLRRLDMRIPFLQSIDVQSS